jgi:hypothetical protein
MIEGATYEDINNVVAFVWGGSSFVKTYKRDDFYLDTAAGVWQRKGNTGPYSGYDQSEFVWRMSSMAGVRFPWKTTRAMRAALRPLLPDENLQKGDLIHVPGGVMIVADRDNDVIVRVSGYRWGKGCIHTCTVAEAFEGISTFDELLTVYRAGGTVLLKDRDGNPLEKEYELTLLKLIG